MLPKVGSSIVNLWFSRGAQLRVIVVAVAVFAFVFVLSGCGNTSQKEQGEPSEPIETAIDTETAIEPESTVSPEAMTDAEVEEQLGYAINSAGAVMNVYCSNASDVDACNKAASKFIDNVIEDTPPQAFRKLITDAKSCEAMDPDTDTEARKKCEEALKNQVDGILENANASTSASPFANNAK